MAATTAPDEEAPLLGGRRVPVTGGIAEPEPEGATLAGFSNQRSRNPNVRATSSTDERPGVVKKTPLPWAQLSIILFLRFAEALTTQVISPVSSLISLPSRFSLAVLRMGELIRALDVLFFAVCTRGWFE